MAVHKQNQRLVLYKEIYDRKQWKKFLQMPMSLLVKDDALVRADLVDCPIAICSPTIPALFSDNFDFQTRSDLIKDILANEDVLNQHIHVQVLPATTYAAAVQDYCSYLDISRQLLQRYCLSLSPDHLVTSSGCSYQSEDNNVYWPADEAFPQRKLPLRNVLVGRGCKISDSAKLINCIIGHNCTVDENAIIENSVLYDNVTVESRTVCETSVVCNNVFLGPKCHVGPRSIVGAKVVLSSGTTVGPGVALQPSDSPKNDMVESAQFCTGVSQWTLQDKKLTFWPETRNCLADTTEEGIVVDISDDDESSASEGSDESAHDESQISRKSVAVLSEDARLFFDEVKQSLQRGVDERLESENLILEINSSKYAYNVSMDELNYLVVRSVLEVALKQQNDDLFAQLKQVLDITSGVLKNYFKTFESQMNLLKALREFSLKSEQFLAVLVKLVHYLYDDLDVLSEDAITAWPDRLSDSESAPVIEKIQPLINWLNEAEEDDSDSA